MQETRSDFFVGLPDPRVVNRCLHKLSDILFIAFITILCNGEDYEDMVTLGEQREDWLRKHISLANGIPSSDTFRRVLERLSPELLGNIVESDGKSLLEIAGTTHICLDGKKSRGASPHTKGNDGLYILTAWASEHKICLGQRRVDDKSNEIVAIPKLLDKLSLEESTVTIDALGCQKEIAKKILKGEGNYLLSLKGNHGNALQDAEWLFSQCEVDAYEERYEYDRTRLETRKCSVLYLNANQKSLFEGWEGLETLVRLESSRTQKGIASQEVRYYMSSHLEGCPKVLGKFIRGHWSIENHLHWHLDVTFREDDSKIKKDFAPENMNSLRKMALQRVSKVEDKLSKKKRRYKASLNIEYLEKIINL